MVAGHINFFLLWDPQNTDDMLLGYCDVCECVSIHMPAKRTITVDPLQVQKINLTTATKKEEKKMIGRIRTKLNWYRIHSKHVNKHIGVTVTHDGAHTNAERSFFSRLKIIIRLKCVKHKGNP